MLHKNAFDDTHSRAITIAMAKPIISTVILNWNRSHLLEQTLQSYIDTVTCPHELWIIDNNSSDNSQEVIERFLRTYPQAKAIRLKENMGGEAFNQVIAQLSGELIYLCENDQIHMPGWCEKALHAFQSYPWLGQFSLHAPVPTDAEAWVTKPVKPRFKNGCLVYQLFTNVTTSCLIRRTLFEKGLRVRNIPNENSAIKLPDDGALGGDIKSMNYWIAYSDHYYVRNIGHEAAEIESNPDYYLPNYEAKTMVGTQELGRRVALQKRLGKLHRQSVIFPEEPVLGELSSQGVGELAPRFWSMFDSRTPEVECVELIHSLVRLKKPSNVLETGGWRGYTTVAIAKALTANGFGKVVTLEDDAHANPYLAERIAELRLDNVLLRNEKSDRFNNTEHFDFAVFNSSYEDQEEEFLHAVPFLEEGATVVFAGERHDKHAIDSRPKTYERLGMITGQYFPTPRGIYVGTYHRPASPDTRRTIFGLSSGRSGTAYLTSLLKGLPGLIALHEPEPKYQWQTLPLQNNAEHARKFVSGPKANWINQLPDATYFEASHYLAKGFMETWVEDCKMVPDAIIIERDPRKIASSWYGLNVDFFTAPSYVLQHMLHPEDKRQLFLPLKNWKALNNYQLCYWYALEAQKRNAYYADYLTSKGGKVFITSLEALISGKDVIPLMEWLNIKLDEEMTSILMQRSKQRINDKNQFKNANRLKSIKEMDLDALEAAVLEQCRTSE